MNSNTPKGNGMTNAAQKMMQNEMQATIKVKEVKACNDEYQFNVRFLDWLTENSDATFDVFAATDDSVHLLFDCGDWGGECFLHPDHVNILE
jgi:hypothetical protein